jgi:hypothetical protein
LEPGVIWVGWMTEIRFFTALLLASQAFSIITRYEDARKTNEGRNRKK